MSNTKIAYIHPMAFPSTEANTFEAIWTASALAEKADTTFFMPRLKSTKDELKRYYDIPGSHLHFQSMHLNIYPDRFLLRFRNYYEKTLSLYLQRHPKWSGFRGQKVLYAREPRELLFWGLQKEKHAWLKEWILFYEAHDILGINPNEFQVSNPFELKSGTEGLRRQMILKAASNFDLVICNTQVLADDLRSWSKEVIQTRFVPLASPLPRLTSPPNIDSFGEKIVIGYIGTIDQYRGVHILLDAMQFLPDKYTLRLVGRFRQEKNIDPDWFNKYREDPKKSEKIDIHLVDSIDNVAKEIDCCDIVVQPASTDLFDSRYTAPLKSYGYMVRGKPIVAGDVPSHRELFRNGKTAALYDLNPRSLAECIINLVNNPIWANMIAQGAWDQSSQYNFARRADDILSLTKLSWDKRLTS